MPTRSDCYKTFIFFVTDREAMEVGVFVPYDFVITLVR